MKKLFIILLVFNTLSAFCQDTEKPSKPAEKKGFKKENLFLGGDLTASFYNGTTVLGINPYFGYSFTRWLDVAVATNLNYSSEKDPYYGDKYRQTIYGPGAFVRVFPFNVVFAQAQYEYNFIHQKYIPARNSGGTSVTQRLSSHSFLIGGGYATGRDYGNSNYFYLSVLWDVAGDVNSPYVDGYGKAIPIIKAGYNIALFQGR